MSEERARKWLEALGFACESEPDWIERGKKPDFFCSGPCDMWAEVKDLDEEHRHAQLGTAFDDLANRFDETALGEPLSIFAYAALPLNQRAAARARTLLRRALGRTESQMITVVVLQQAEYQTTMSYEFPSNNGQHTVFCYGSRAGANCLPPHAEPDDWFQKVVVTASDGTTDEITFSKLGHGQPAILALKATRSVEVSSFSVGGIVSTHQLTVKDRLRRAVSDANKQIRNGNKYREAPGLVVVLHDLVIGLDDWNVYSALYGDMTVHFGIGSSDEIYLGQNGIWRETKNTSTSALAIFQTDNHVICVHNCYANLPLQTGIFGNEEWAADAAKGLSRMRPHAHAMHGPGPATQIRNHRHEHLHLPAHVRWWNHHDDLLD